MNKKFRNTKARRREMNMFNKLWKQSKNKVYYRRYKYGIDFNSSLPLTRKNEINKLSTKEIKKINKELTKINTKNSKFWESVQFDHISIPKSKVDEMRKLESQLQNIQDELDKKDMNRPIFIGSDEMTNDTVLSQRLMSKPNTTLISNIKPYDFNKATKLGDIESAINVRKKRLDPEWIRERQAIMQTNFINSLIILFNDEADQVVDMLKKLPSDDFYEMYEQFDSLDFSYVPSSKTNPDDTEMGNLDTIMDILGSYFNGEVDTSGKVFN